MHDGSFGRGLVPGPAQLDGRIPRQVIKEMLEESYRLVVASLPAAQRHELEGDGARR